MNHDDMLRIIETRGSKRAEPLTITPLSANGTVSIKATGMPRDLLLEVSEDGGLTWKAVAAQGTNGNVVNLGTATPKLGLKVRGSNPNGISISSGNYWVLSCNSSHNVSGDITTLLDPDGLDALTQKYCFYCFFDNDSRLYDASLLDLHSIHLSSNCYYFMFRDCTSLKETPKLPATELAEGCYRGMFSGCNSLITAPALPAKVMAENCYRGMLEKCLNLINAPELNATTLAPRCYRAMFWNCVNLEVAPIIHDANIALLCYESMFTDCKSLRYVTMEHTSWHDEYQCFSGWMISINSVGTFRKMSELPEEYGISRIPTGWNVVNIDVPETTETAQEQTTDILTE